MFLNDYSQTIGKEVSQAEAAIAVNPQKFTGYTWKSKMPEFIYCERETPDGRLIMKFHFFLFAGKVQQVKETSDKIFYRLTDSVVSALTVKK